MIMLFHLCVNNLLSKLILFIVDAEKS